MIVGAGKSEICVAGQQSQSGGKVDVALWSLESMNCFAVKF